MMTAVPSAFRRPMSQRDFLQQLNAGLKKPMWTMDGPNVVPLIMVDGDIVMTKAFAYVESLMMQKCGPKDAHAAFLLINQLRYWIAIEMGLAPHREYLA